MKNKKEEENYLLPCLLRVFLSRYIQIKYSRNNGENGDNSRVVVIKMDIIGPK